MLAFAGVADPQAAHQSFRSYRAPDGTLVARIVAADKALSVSEVESLVEIRTTGGKLIMSRDYSSDDGLHGFGVVKAQWTPDSHFFVYSMTSSGADRPWYTPIDVYSRADQRIARLDSMIGERPTLSAAFDIVAPDWVEDVTWKDAEHPEDYVSVRIDLAKAFRRHDNQTANRAQ